MTKYVLALVLLLHLCHSAKSNIQLNREIIRGLDGLNKLYRANQSNITESYVRRVPSKEMHTNALSCVGVFAWELNQLLDNVTLHDEGMSILKQLKANLKALGPQKESDQKCPMSERDNSLTPFSPYAAFLRTLNKSPRR